MGAGEKVASSNKGVVKIGDPCDFSSTPLKQGTNNKQWLAETRKNFSGTDLILVIVSLITYVLDTVTGNDVPFKFDIKKYCCFLLLPSSSTRQRSIN